MAETINYNLYVESNDQVKFREWREKVAGENDSNMVKIDNALAGKQDKLTGTNGATVDNENNTVSVDLPTVALSQEEYDALTEEEKQRNIIYAVPSGSGNTPDDGLTKEYVDNAIANQIGNISTILDAINGEVV